MAETQPKTKPNVSIPEAYIVVFDAKEFCVLSPDGELKTLPLSKAKNTLRQQAIIACHAPYTSKKLNLFEQPAFDILELFAFAYPATFCVPTPTGVAKTLEIEFSNDLEEQTMTIIDMIQHLLNHISNDPRREDLIHLAKYMDHWSWSPFVLKALGVDLDKPVAPTLISDIAFWKKLPKWEETAPRPAPSQDGVTPEEAQELLDRWLSEKQGAEKRDTQIEYSKQLTHGFAPIIEEGKPQIVLSEAETGVGKTLGYLAPTKKWSQKNKGSVWISTYTKNLQSQIMQEAIRTGLDIHTRKGRENYLCLLNLEESVKRAALSTNQRDTIASGIMLRWLMVTKDGDLGGINFPGWLMGLLGVQNSLSLGDRRGECIFAACDHYQSCYIEHAVRKSKEADIVVSNHALVMYLSAIEQFEDTLPTRYVFDEGHHLFDAADNAFAAHLSGRETSDLRRWILGAENFKRSRARGLQKRLEGLIEGDGEGREKLDDVLKYARALPPQDWKQRLNKQEEKLSTTETFLKHVSEQVIGRNDTRNEYYSLETPKMPVNEDIILSALELAPRYKKLLQAIQKLKTHFKQKLDEQADELNKDTRKRLESIILSLKNRAEMPLTAWASMLDQINTATPEDFTDWFSIERIDGKNIDIGMYRHWVDPMIPFTANMRERTQGMVVTSATLRDNQGEWDSALTQTGLQHFNAPVHFFAAPSPFDYASQAKIIIVNDIPKGNVDSLGTAYRELMMASQGSALGIFTSIKRLKDIYEKIHGPLTEKNIPLYAQHIDDMDIGTMIDIFREEERACLLGTDAIRDGIDVPGDSLRMIVFDKVPWPRPTLLHKARRNAFGSKEYDDRLTRLKLKQAFGRLIRSKNDKGVFVILDSMLPSRLLNAFPESIEVQRIGLKDAIEVTKSFLNNYNE